MQFSPTRGWFSQMFKKQISKHSSKQIFWHQFCLWKTPSSRFFCFYNALYCWWDFKVNLSFPRPKPPPRMCLCWIAAIYLLTYLLTYFLTYFLTRIWICRQVGGILKWILTLHKIKATYCVEYLNSLVIEQLEREF